MSNTTNTPVVFLAFANDRDDTIGYLRNLPNEARRLLEVLESAQQAGLCEVVSRSNSTAGDIFKVFQDSRYRGRIAIFHYGGHANGYQLLLEGADGQSAAADAGGFAEFLGQQEGLQLVFLNGCSTENQTQGLLAANIPAVISTSRAIDDRVATDFSIQFYQGLAGGANLRTAYNEAEASVKTVKGGNTRGAYFVHKDGAQATLDEDRWPWNLYLRKGSENADQWNLPDAVDDPLFGLPPLLELDLPDSPYRYLKWFTRQDAEVFFGRGHQIRALHDRLTAPGTAPIMLFYGQSGVGKSSILDAGLIPRLEKECEVLYLRRNQDGLLATLQSAFPPEASIDTAWRLKEELTGKPFIMFLDQVEELYTRPVADQPDELDQFLNTVQSIFIKSATRPLGKLVLGFRKEWLAELESQLVEYGLPRSKLYLEPLNRRGIMEVVEGPSRSGRLGDHFGLTVEDGLSEMIADDLLSDRDSAVAPTLQILLTKMWNTASAATFDHPHFTKELYLDLKRDGILMRDFLNQQIAAYRERYPDVVDSGLLLDIVALHTTPLGTADQKSVAELQQQYSHMGPALPDLLQQFQDLHLLTVASGERQDNARTTRLAHDTLAPLIRERFDESDKPGQRARRILDNRCVDWEDGRKGTPLDEADLVIVEGGTAGTRALNETEQRILAASRELREKLQRTSRILKTCGVTAVLAIVAALGFATVMWSNAAKAHDAQFSARKDADEKKQEAEDAKELADDAKQEATDERDKAQLQLAQNLWNIGASQRDAFKDSLMASHYFMLAATEFRNSPSELRDAQLAGETLVRNSEVLAIINNNENSVRNKSNTHLLVLNHDDSAAVIEVWEFASGSLQTTREYNEISNAAISDDGTKVLCSGPHGRWGGWIEVFDASTGDVLGRREVSGTSREDIKRYSGATFNYDGNRVLSWDTAGRIEVWESEGEKLISQFDHESGEMGAVFDRNGSRVLSWNNEGLTQVWSVDGGDVIASCQRPGPVSEAVFDNAENRVLVRSTDSLVQVLDVESDKLLMEYRPENKDDFRLREAKFTQDGTRILLRIDDYTNRQRNSARVEIHDVDTTQEIRSWEFPDQIGGAMFNQDETQLLVWSGNIGQLVQVFDVQNGDVLAKKTPQRFLGTVMGATFGETSDFVLVWGGGQDGGWVLHFEVGSGRQFEHIHPGRVNGAIFGMDDTRVLSWCVDGTAHLWDVATEEVIAETRHKDAMMDGAFSEDEGLVLSLDSNATRAWTVNDNLLTYENQPHPGIEHAVFNPDGTQVLSWGSNNERQKVRLWNVRDGELLLERSPEGTIAGGVFCEDQARILNWTGNGLVRLWHAESEDLIQKWEVPDIQKAILGENGKFVLCWDNEGTVQLWDAESGESVATSQNLVDMQDSYNAGVTVNQDATRLLSWKFDNERNDNFAQLWTIKNGELIAGREHKIDIGNGNATFSSDGSSVLSYNYFDSLAKLWDTETGEMLAEFNHATQVINARFCEDGHRVLTCSFEGTVRLWTDQGLLIAERKISDRPSAVMSDDGSQVLLWDSSPSLNSAYLWDVSADYTTPAKSLPLGVEVRTGTRLDRKLNKVISLSRDEWLERKKLLEDVRANGNNGNDN